MQQITHNENLGWFVSWNKVTQRNKMGYFGHSQLNIQFKFALR